MDVNPVTNELVSNRRHRFERQAHLRRLANRNRDAERRARRAQD